MHIKQVKDLRNPDELIKLLSETPGALTIAKRQLRTAQREFNKRQIALSVEAMTAPIFDGKAATNDKQRDLAVKHVCANDKLLLALEDTLNESKEMVVFWESLAKNARLIARLQISQPSEVA